MDKKVVKLIPRRPDVTLSAYTMCDHKRPAMIVLPGGGYSVLAYYEGEPVAVEFMSYGFNAFVLRYSIGKPNCNFPNPLQEVSAAIAHIRENAEEYRIDPDRIFVCGFSAGGHLAGCIGTMWKLDAAKFKPDMEYGINRPTGVILSYPVTTTDPAYSHGCIKSIIDDTEYALEDGDVVKHVDSDSAPAFIWHSERDRGVHPMNSLMTAEAYARADVPYEIHIYSDGDHGIGLGTKITADPNWPRMIAPLCAKWAEAAANWALSF